eukprot:m.204020 g.204020  ORF g.204020 m.204020 type:complete len:57 (-) comp15004_c0_seq8:59-229(-)
MCARVLLACTMWSTCAAGKYISAAGTASSDRGCTGCATGTYTAVTNKEGMIHQARS